MYIKEISMSYTVYVADIFLRFFKIFDYSVFYVIGDIFK